VAAALEEEHGDRRAAAQAIGCCRTTITNYIARYALVHEAFNRAREASGPRRRYRYRPAEVASAVRQCDGRLYAAADLLKCDRATVFRYVRLFPEVREAYEEARVVVIDRVDSKLIEAVDRGELPAVIFVLSHLGKDRGYTRRWRPGDHMEDDEMAEMLAVLNDAVDPETGDWIAGEDNERDAGRENMECNNE
jgi:hypothetical protein